MGKILCKDIEKISELKETLKTLGIKSLTNDINTEWLRIKHNFVGGSEAGVICGLSPFTSPTMLGVSKAKKFSVEENTPEKKYMFDVGHALEPILGHYYESQTGNAFEVDRRMFQSEENDFAIVDLDGLSVTSDGELRILEFKFTNPRAASGWKSGVDGEDGVCAVPTYYYQVQHAMYVLGNNINELFNPLLEKYGLDKFENDRIEKADIVVGSTNSAQDVKIVTVKRDDKLIAEIIRKEREFMENLEKGIVPIPAKLSDEELKKINSSFKDLDETLEVLSKEGDEEAMEEIIEKQEKIKSLNSQIDNLEERINALKLPILAKFEAEGLKEGKIVEGSYQALLKETTRKSFDSKRLEKEDKKLYDFYVKKSVSQKLSISKKEKE